MPRLKKDITFQNNPAEVKGSSAGYIRMMADEDSEKVTLVLDGYIGSWYSVNKTELKWQLNGHNPDVLEIRVNSLGGDLIQTIDMYNFLVLFIKENDVTSVIVDGVGNCASAATMFFLLATKGKARAASNVQILYHQPSAGAWGTVEVLERAVKELRNWQDIAIEMYEQRTSMTRDEILDFLKEDTWHRASHVKSLGLIDEVYEVSAPTQMLSKEQVQMYRLPELLITKTKEIRMPKKKKLRDKFGAAFDTFRETMMEVAGLASDLGDGGEPAVVVPTGTPAAVVATPAATQVAPSMQAPKEMVIVTMADGTEVEIAAEHVNSGKQNRNVAMANLKKAVDEKLEAIQTQMAAIGERMERAGNTPPDGVQATGIPDGVTAEAFVEQSFGIGGDYGFRATAKGAIMQGRPRDGTVMQDKHGRYGYGEVERVKTGDPKNPELNQIEQLFMKHESYFRTTRNFSMCAGVDCNSINVGKLNQELGACSNLLSNDIIYRGMADFDLMECFTLVENVKDQMTFLEMIMNPMIQNWTCDITPKPNAFQWCTSVGEVCPGKVDLCMCLQELTKTYFARLLSPGFTPWNYTFSSFLYEMLIKQVYKDLVCSLAQSKRDDSVAGTPAANEMTWMNGMQATAQSWVDDGFPTVATGDIYAPGRQCEIVEEMQCSLHQDYQMADLCLFVPPAFYKALIKDLKEQSKGYHCINEFVKDSKFQMLNMNEGNIKVISYPKWGASQRLILIPKWNNLLLTDEMSDFNKLEVQKKGRREIVMMDFQIGSHWPVKSPDVVALNNQA